MCFQDVWPENKRNDNELFHMYVKKNVIKSIFERHVFFLWRDLFHNFYFQTGNKIHIKNHHTIHRFLKGDKVK